MSDSSSSLSRFSNEEIQEHVRREFRRCLFSNARTGHPIGVFTGYSVVEQKDTEECGLQLNYEILRPKKSPIQMSETFFYIENNKLKTHQYYTHDGLQIHHVAPDTFVTLKRRFLSLGIDMDVLDSQEFEIPTWITPKSRHLDAVIRKQFLIIERRHTEPQTYQIEHISSLNEVNVTSARKLYTTEASPEISQEEDRPKSKRLKKNN